MPKRRRQLPPTLADDAETAAGARAAGELRPRAVRTRGASQLYGPSESWFETARVNGTGPPFIKVAPGLVIYLISDLEAYFSSRRRISTSEAAVRAEGMRREGSERRAGSAAGGQGRIKSGRGRRRRAAAGDDAP
jgi:hypothetical protein